MRLFLSRVFLSRINMACAAYVTIGADCDLRARCRRQP